MRKYFIIHPFPFAVFPILSIYLNNMNQVDLSVIYLPIGASIICTAALLYLSGYLFKDLHKAALLVSILLFFFFSYGHFSKIIASFSFGDFVFRRNLHRGLLYIFIFATVISCFLYAMREIKDSHKIIITKIINIVSITLICFVLFRISNNIVNGHNTKISRGHSSTETKPNKPLVYRDIYFIILDGYAGMPTLNQIFSFDNAEFMDFLHLKGFITPRNCRSNFCMTDLSLPSTTSMDYNHVLEGDPSIDERKAIELIKSEGYKYVDIHDINNIHLNGILQKVSNDNFIVVLCNTTMIQIITFRFNLYSDHYRKRIISSFDSLEKASKIDGPKFVYAHIMAPHPPYVFNSDGSKTKNIIPSVSLNPFKIPWDDLQGYINQLIFINKKISKSIEIILNNSALQPIIIIQADHGPKFSLELSQQYRVHTNIFSAYYLPDKGSNAIYDEMTSVNTFRIILNSYFGYNFPLLPDKVFYSTNSEPYKFTDITDF